MSKDIFRKINYTPVTNTIRKRTLLAQESCGSNDPTENFGSNANLTALNLS